MTHVTLSSPSLLDRVAGAFRVVGDLFDLLVTARARAERLEQIVRLSDEALAARGTTREAEIQRILA